MIYDVRQHEWSRGTHAMTTHVATHAKFYRNPFRGFGAPGDRNLAFFITLAIGFATACISRE